MRVIVSTADREAAGWLRAMLGAAGLTVAVLEHPDPQAPELAGGDLLIADRQSAALLAGAGPPRRMLLVPRGQTVDVTETLSGGFLDLIVLPAPEEDVLAKVGRALDRFLRPPKAVREAWIPASELRSIVQRVAKALRQAGKSPPIYELVESMLSVLMLLCDSHETMERGTPGHSRRVGQIAGGIAQQLGLRPASVAWLELAGRIHDLGMVPLHIPLRDAAPLSLDVRRNLARHPQLGAEILQPLARYGLPVAAIRAHHERLDGSGYPDGLAGERLPLDAQILGAADVFEALTSPRPWRAAETVPAALEAMRSARWFSAEILEALEAWVASSASRPG